jgi:hypothetical protein
MGFMFCGRRDAALLDTGLRAGICMRSNGGDRGHPQGLLKTTPSFSRNGFQEQTIINLFVQSSNVSIHSSAQFIRTDISAGYEGGEVVGACRHGSE